MIQAKNKYTYSIQQQFWLVSKNNHRQEKKLSNINKNKYLIWPLL